MLRFGQATQTGITLGSTGGPHGAILGGLLGFVCDCLVGVGVALLSAAVSNETPSTPQETEKALQLK